MNSAFAAPATPELSRLASQMGSTTRVRAGYRGHTAGMRKAGMRQRTGSRHVPGAATSPIGFGAGAPSLNWDAPRGTEEFKSTRKKSATISPDLLAWVPAAFQQPLFSRQILSCSPAAIPSWPRVRKTPAPTLENPGDRLEPNSGEHSETHGSRTARRTVRADDSSGPRLSPHPQAQVKTPHWISFAVR